MHDYQVDYQEILSKAPAQDMESKLAILNNNLPVARR